ncbi:hypothetical protein [Winogradskyella arenosi]|uniref:Putative secreted protein (Por secretion system target) n=1 Tax=Winogradskyella arenosi TaxID=533325 RepID=A0A368ZL89_9FLAO|nr:hypothetical protein [Winogradskyella arenosi]RCW92385.1 putative secreted protein (Por secretion system target) [Winogradskyella arenosi]
MKKKILGTLLIFLWSITLVSAQETVKVMFYNLLNFPSENAVSNRITDLAYILSDYQPDLFLVCELNTFEGATAILGATQTSIDANFQMATFVTNTSDDNSGDQNDLQNLLFYNSSKFSIEEEIIVPTDLRDFNIYRLQLNTVNQESNPIKLYVIIGHLKASNGTENSQRRATMVNNLENYLDNLPSDANVILGGDLNIYTANESAFQDLISPSNTITFIDPANRIGSWHNNTDYADVFTQSTRTQTGFGGATGGFDDRFDFILTSKYMASSAAITYVPNSYQAYGNNGLESCWNHDINAPECETVGSPFSYELRTHLYNFSDHLPVTLALTTNETFLSVKDYTASLGLILENTMVPNELRLQVNNTAIYEKTIVIYNHLGQRIKSVQLNSNPLQHLNVSDLRDGLYYIKSSTNAFQPLKFIHI